MASLQQKPDDVRRIFPVRPDLEAPDSGLAIWLTEPLGMVTQPVGHLSERDAEFIVTDGFERLVALGLSATRRGYFVHDFSDVRTYEPEARQKLVRWGMAVRETVERVIIVFGPRSPRLVRMGAQVGAAALVVVGMPIETESDVHAALRKYRLMPRALVRRGAGAGPTSR